MAACGGWKASKQRDSIDSLPRMCGGGVFDLSPPPPPPVFPATPCPPAASRKPGSCQARSGRSGRVRLTLVARGCQPPTHATTKLPLKGDPAMAAGLVVFRFRGELSLSPFPSILSILSSVLTLLHRSREPKRDGGGRGGVSEWRKERATAKGEKGCIAITRSFKGTKGGKAERERKRVEDYIARKQQPPFILLHYHTN